MRITELLALRGDVKRLRARAAAGDEYAEMYLLTTLAALGRVDELEEEVAAGTFGARDILATLQPSQDDGGA